MSFNETDEELAILYKEGNKEAFKGLINRYTFPLYNFTAHIVNQNDASDVVQEIFIKTWKSIHKFDEKKASFKTWIFTIARNTAIDFLRKKRNLLFSDIPARQLAGGEKESENENSFAENIPDENLLPDEALQKLEDSEFLNRTLEKLNIKETAPSELVELILTTAQVISVGSEELRKAIEQVILENPKAVEDYKSGKTQAIGFLIGKVKSLLPPKSSTDKIKEQIEQALK